MSSDLLRYQCGLSAQCVNRCNRCDDKCENPVLLETQGACGSARRCRDDTATHDTSALGKCHMCRSTHRLILRLPHFPPEFHHSVYPTSEHIILRRSCSPRHDVSCTKQRKGLDPVWPEIDTESSLAPHLYHSLSVALGISIARATRQGGLQYKHHSFSFI